MIIGKARPDRARGGDGVNGRKSSGRSAVTRWRRRIMRVGATALVVATATAASASPLLFSYVGTDGSGSAQSLSFTLDDSPTPYAFNDHITYFYPLTATYQGSNIPNSEVYFSTPVYGGGFNFNPPNGAYLSASGAQLFSGATSSPMFSPGIFNLQGGLATNGGTLTIAAAAAPGAPGPEVGFGWASALVSFGALAATRLRRRATA